MESKKRSLLKTISFRLLAIAATIPFTGLTTAIGIHILLGVLYYIHERAWLRIKWGMEN